MPVKICCTYCSIQTDSTPKPIPAIQRWRTDRVTNADRLAADCGVPLLLLSAQEGLIEKEKLVPAGGQTLDGQKLRTKARHVQRQLEAKNISELIFLATPSSELAINYLRLITLACDYANVRLTVLDHRGHEFPRWSNVFEQAEEARRRASKGVAPVEEAFHDLMKNHEDDGIVWFKRGEALFDRGRFRDALASFREAETRLPMREWRDAARQKIKEVERNLPSHATIDESTDAVLEKIDRIVANPQIRRLCKDAFRVANDSPSASILLSFAAIEQIDKKITLRGELERKFKNLKEYRNRVAHDGQIAEPLTSTARRFREVLLKVIEFAHNQKAR